MKKLLANLLPKNKAARGVSVLVGGTAGAQVLSILIAPLLTRLYAPADFGLLAVYSGLLAVCVVIASLRYELAILLPESDNEAVSLVVLSFLASIGATISCVIAIYFFGEWLASALDVPELAMYLWLLPVGVLLGGV